MQDRHESPAPDAGGSPPAPTMATITRNPRTWGLSGWLAVLLGALYGLLMRVIFGQLQHWTSWLGLTRDDGYVMSLGFVHLTPMVVGAITIYGMRASRPTWTQAVFTPWIATALMMIGAMATLLEGAICVVLMTPLFLAMASIGGVVMNLMLRHTRLGTVQLGVLAVLPLLVVALDGPLTAERWQRIDRSVVVDAPPERLWAEIVSARDIRRDEFPVTWIHLIGVPRPVEGINRMTPQGELRMSRWERGVHFVGHVTERVEERRLAWRYEFSPDSFPPGTMDEHVVIGGRHFDLGETRFILTPLSAGRTRLDIEAHFRVTSSFNGYAVAVSEFLGRDFVDGLLALYKRRAEIPA